MAAARLNKKPNTGRTAPIGTSDTTKDNSNKDVSPLRKGYFSTTNLTKVTKMSFASEEDGDWVSTTKGWFFDNEFYEGDENAFCFRGRRGLGLDNEFYEGDERLCG